MKPLALDMTDIQPYQRQLALLALQGRERAITTLAKNYGCLTWRGEVDTSAALEVAEHLIAEGGPHND